MRPGDRVLTAGIDGVYPRGIPIGTIASVEPGGSSSIASTSLRRSTSALSTRSTCWNIKPCPQTLKEASPEWKALS